MEKIINKRKKKETKERRKRSKDTKKKKEDHRIADKNTKKKNETGNEHSSAAVSILRDFRSFSISMRVGTLIVATTVFIYN